MSPNDGTQMNNPTPISGMVAGALSFAGTQQANQYVEVPHSGEIDFGTGDISIDAWIRTDSNNTLEIFIDKREDRPTIGPVGYSFFLENGRLSFQLADDPNSWYNYSDPTSLDLRDGEWHFVAVTVDRDQDDGGTLYLDGQPIHTFNPMNRPNSISNDGDLWIGKHHANSAFNIEMWFDGALDEVELFNRTLDASEIQAIYQAGEHGKCKDDNNDDDQGLLTCEDAEGYLGDTLLVDLIATGTDVYGLQVNAAVDPAIVAPQSATFGNFFDSPYLTGINHPDAAAGTWDGAASQLNPNPPVTGSGTFASVTYQAISPGSSNVALTPLFSDRDGFEIPGSASSCLLTVLDYGEISSTVTYQGRLTHADIDVVATGPVTNNDLTDGNGDFDIGGLKAGDYQVMADAPSYLPACTTPDVTVSHGQLTNLLATRLLGGDVNDDIVNTLIIDIGDFTRLGWRFGQPASVDVQADINADGIINVQDLSILGGNYGVSGCQDWPS
jgi:hypothetical protein